MPRLVERSITATLPQAHATVKLKFVGSGQIQDDMKKDGRSSFEDMMSGIRSDMTSYVHGGFRRQIVEFLAQQECETHESAIEYGTTLSDDDLHISVHVQVTFGKDMPLMFKRGAVMALAGSCIETASANTAEARALLSGNGIVIPNPGQLQTITVSPEVYQQLIAQKASGEGTAPSADFSLTQKATSPNSDSPGQYL